MIKLKDILNEKHVPGHDKEGKMAKFDAKEACQDAADVFKMIDEYDDLPEWLEAKITKAADYLNSVKDYLTHHQNGVKEGNIGITTKKGKSIELTHRKSGKEIVVLNNPGVLKKYKKLGYLISMPEGKLNEGKESIFDVAARVMKDKQHQNYKSKKGMVKVDMQTANLLTKVWKKVNPKMKKILSDLGYKNPAQLV